MGADWLDPLSEDELDDDATDPTLDGTALCEDEEDEDEEDEFLGFLAGDIAADTDFLSDLFGF
jgi:hypothetical protein